MSTINLKVVSGITNAGMHKTIADLMAITNADAAINVRTDRGAVLCEGITLSALFRELSNAVKEEGNGYF